jgi:spore coat polysaccharide biosynthesis predicted glycosyltransferase SpsG
MPRPVVVFRVAGASGLGFGHVRRCWTLAAELGAEADVRFVTATPEAADVLGAAGFVASAEATSGDLSLLEATLAAAERAVVAVVDDPDLPGEAVLELRRRAPVAVIDDACTRVLPADLVINGSAGAEDLPHRGAPETRYLLGPDYMILRREFARAPVRPRAAKEIRRVLLLGGGGAAVGAVLDATLRALEAALPAAEVEVVVGPFAPMPALSRGRPVMVHRDPRDIRALMLAADLAVTGGGQTAYELAATATPAVGLRLAENQRVNLRGLAAAGVLVDVGSPDDAGFHARFADTLSHLAADADLRARMGQAGRRLVDGGGAGRVAAELLALASAGALRG